MITIYHDQQGQPHVQIGNTPETINSDKKDGIEHIPVPTEEAPAAAQFLEALEGLAPEASYQIESLLTTIYKMGVEAGRKPA